MVAQIHYVVSTLNGPTHYRIEFLLLSSIHIYVTLKWAGFIRSTEKDGEKIFEYYENSRLDGLIKLQVEVDCVREYYEYRQNR